MRTPGTLVTRQKKLNGPKFQYVLWFVLATLLAGVVAVNYPVSSATSYSPSHRLLADGGAAPLAAGDITVRSAYESGIPGNQTFTLVKEFFTSTDCTAGPSGQTQDTGVNSSTGVTFAKPGSANSVKLIAPNQDPGDPIQRTDQNGVWSSWNSATPFAQEPFHNQRICVAYSDIGGGTATFVARFSAGLITRAASGGVCGAASPKTLFNIGEQVCIQFFFDPAITTGSALHSATSSPPYPTNCVRDVGTNVTTDTGTYVFTLPGTETSANPCGGGVVVDNRGTWDIQGQDAGNAVRASNLFRVHNPAVGHEAVDLSVMKAPVGVATVSCGSNLSWNISVSNKGPDTAQNATLIDPLPVSTTFQSISVPAGWTCSNPPVNSTGNISCTNASLPAAPLGGSSVVSTITVVAKAVSGLPNNAKITNGTMVSSLTKDLFTPDNDSFISGDAVFQTASCVAAEPAIFRSAGVTTAVLTAESCPQPSPAPANFSVDPREQVTMSFFVQNLSGRTTAHLRGTLQATGGVTSPTAGTVQFGNGTLAAGGGEQSASFSFTVANVNCGASILASIDVLDDMNANLGTVQWRIPTGSGGGGAPIVCCVGPTAAMGTITGTITDGGMPVSGAVVKLTGSQNRTIITDAGGTYRFEDVETNGFYTVTPSRANYTFNPREQSFSQTGNTTNAAFAATRNAAAVLNDIDTPGYFVRQHYLDFLGREPDESGFNFWSDQILGCGGDAGCLERRRINVSAAYFLSIEFKQTGGLVDQLYGASYGRRPLYNEFTPERRTIANGVRVGYGDWVAELEANKQAFVEAWVQRASFRQVYDALTHDQYVNTLIANTGVNFSQTEKAALVGGLTAGTFTRADVLRQIAEDDRFAAARRNEAFVMMQYFGYLGRDPDASGYQFWLAKLNQFNGNFEQAEMVKAFIVSGEYRARFTQ